MSETLRIDGKLLVKGKRTTAYADRFSPFEPGECVVEISPQALRTERDKALEEAARHCDESAECARLIASEATASTERQKWYDGRANDARHLAIGIRALKVKNGK